MIAIEGGTLIDGTGSPPLAGMTILIEGNRIREIGRQGELTLPSGVRVISATGKYIIPGLIDSHVHYRYPWLHRLYLANGVTTVRDMGGQIERVLTLRQELRVGNILGPRMVVSGMAINPRSVKAMGVGSPQEMARKLVEAGVDGIKVTGYTSRELEEIVDVAHANGLLVYGHTGPRIDGRAPGALVAVEAGLDGVEHAYGILEDSMGQAVEVPSDFDPSIRDHLFRYWYGRMHRNFDTDKAETLIQSMVQSNVYFSPTLVNINRNARTPQDLEANPLLRYIPEGDPNTMASFGEEERREWASTMVRMKEITRRFQQAGGLLIAGTDSANGATLPGWSLHWEMELFVEAGISPMEALQAATLNNARVLHMDQDLGTVQVGKYADLVLLDEDPLENIQNTQKIHRVIKDGLLLDPRTLLEENLEQFGIRAGER
jgi:imidazolonepropionase-like amidohydrolase